MDDVRKVMQTGISYCMITIQRRNEISDSQTFDTVISLTDVPLGLDHPNHHNFVHPGRSFDRDTVEQIVGIRAEDSLLVISDDGQSRATAVAVLHHLKTGSTLRQAVTAIRNQFPLDRQFNPNPSLLEHGLHTLMSYDDPSWILDSGIR